MSAQTSFPVLGNVTAQQFLDEYWQKKPLLVRSAFPDFEAPINADELAGLSLEEEVESRIVLTENWQLQQGPFSEATYKRLPDREWTLLVQAVDLWVPEVAELKSKFAFLPPWRLDDIMVSYATDGGSVGPHFDYYDVFLIQGQGKRCWQVGHTCHGQEALVEGTHLKILEEFSPIDEWVLEPGDMLYLPPKVAHHGVALGECTTLSVGFRAPTVVEMLGDLATELLSSNVPPQYLSDPPLSLEMASGDISDDYIRQVKQLLSSALDNDELIGDWFARYMTSPKYPDCMDASSEHRSATWRKKHYLNGMLES